MKNILQVKSKRLKKAVKKHRKILEEQRELLKQARTEAQAIIENAKKQGEDNVKKSLLLLVLKRTFKRISSNMKSTQKKKKQLLHS